MGPSVPCLMCQRSLAFELGLAQDDCRTCESRSIIVHLALRIPCSNRDFVHSSSSPATTSLTMRHGSKRR